MATTATPWTGAVTGKLYLQSGQFTAVIKDSEDVSGVDNVPAGISWSGTNTPWVDYTNTKLYLQSGQFTAVVKDSQDVSGVDNEPYGISVDDTDTFWCGVQADKLYLQSGQFTATLKDSQDVSGIDTDPSEPCWDGANVAWIGHADKKLYLQSGKFSSTLKDSQGIGGVDSGPSGISWDGTNTPWIGFEADKLYLQSGQFTGTLKDSQGIGGVDGVPRGISTDDYHARITPLRQSLTDTVSISDSIDTTIIRVPFPSQPVTDTIIIGDSVLMILNDDIIIIDPLTITDTVDETLNAISIIDYLAITSTFYKTVIQTESVTDSLTISDAVIIDQNSYALTDTLPLLQFVDLNNERERAAGNILTISDSIGVSTAQYAPKIIDILIITDSIAETVPRHIVIEDELSITDTTDGIFQYNISIEDEFDILYIDPDNLIIYRIMDHIDMDYIATRTPLDFLTILNSVQVAHEKDSATIDVASNTLTITDSVDMGRSLGNTITISDQVTITQGQLTKVTLSITDAVELTKEVNKSMIDSLVLSITVQYTHTKTHTHHEYSPFVGVSTDPDAPTPPSLSEPSITIYPNVILTYPVSNPTHTLTLTGPELRNQNQLGFTRINRETRGGTLIVFADPIWPKREQLNLQFTGLSETQGQDVLNFLRDTLGKQIKLRDWEGNERTVIILTPDNPVTREGFCQNTISLNFESATIL